MLDPTSAKAFAVEYFGEGGKSIDPDTAGADSQSVSTIKVTTKLKTGDESRSFTRLFHLESLIPVMQISLDAGSLQ